MLKFVSRASRVEASAPAQFDPSLVRNSGSRPSEASNRCRTLAGVMVHPSSAA